MSIIRMDINNIKGRPLIKLQKNNKVRKNEIQFRDIE